MVTKNKRFANVKGGLGFRLGRPLTSTSDTALRTSRGTDRALLKEVKAFLPNPWHKSFHHGGSAIRSED